MNELVKLGEKTYVLKSPVNIGFYILNDNEICLIDTGNSKDYAKMIDKILVQNNWQLKYIINTHSHADHIGGNKYLQNKYHCQILASKEESFFINKPLLEPAMLYGASPLNEMCHHFLMADESQCKAIEDIEIKGISIINLPGHSLGLIGIITSDDVCFVGDAYTSEEIINKYAIQYAFDIEKSLDTINYLNKTQYKFYVPAHGNIESDPHDTLKINENNIYEIENNILNWVEEEINFNDLLNKIFSYYHIKSNIIQYYLISSTIKAYITKLVNDNKLLVNYQDGYMILNKVKNI